jgi:hypothetical protein
LTEQWRSTKSTTVITWRQDEKEEEEREVEEEEEGRDEAEEEEEDEQQDAEVVEEEWGWGGICPECSPQSGIGIAAPIIRYSRKRRTGKAKQASKQNNRIKDNRRSVMAHALKKKPSSTKINQKEKAHQNDKSKEIPRTNEISRRM